MKNILIIDDETKLRSLLAKIIKLEGFEVIEVGDCKTAIKKLDIIDIDVVICDVKLPDGNGLALSKAIKENHPCIEVILLTAYGTIPDSVQAIKNGAFDYITKGDDNNKILPLLYKALEKVELSKRIFQLEKEVDKKYSFDNVIGKSKPILEAIELARRVAPMDTTVLLLGETGTGKEVFAQSIHQASNRNKKSFVAVNCSAFSKEILESELFGHKAGAFTGAIKDKKGLFEEANEGTLFLDEVGEMAIELQAKLLRVLETGEFIKVGATRCTKVNVRIIAATNQKLEDEINANRFRSDLYYRLAVFSILLPPLRERKKDIRLLTEQFVKILGYKINKRNLLLSDEFIAALENYTWKGNIRELKNVIERSVILTDDNSLNIEHLPIEIRQNNSNISNSSLIKCDYSFSMSNIEKLHIQKVLHYTKGNKTEAARLLEIGIATLYRKIDEYGIVL